MNEIYTGKADICQDIHEYSIAGKPCIIAIMTRGARIKTRLKELKMSPYRLAKEMGVKPQSVYDWLKDKGPDRDKMPLLAKVLKCFPEWLEFGTIASAEIVREAPVPYNPRSSIVTTEDLGDKYAFIPRYEANISAGHGYHNGDHVEVSKTHAYRWDWIRKHGWRSEDLCVIEASGHSMEPRISDGDVLLVNRGEKEIQSEEVYILSFPTEGVRAKRLHWMADGRLRISSDNPDKSKYPDELYSPEEASHLNIIGRVVHRAGRL